MAERAADRNPTDAPRTPNGSVLDRPVLGNLNLEKSLYLLVWLVAIVSRLYIAGERPLHHDESIHAVFSWKIVTEGAASYKYDPVYHGPVLYFWSALCFLLFGDSDFVSRLSPVLFGFGILALAWPLRRYLGRWGALWFLILVTLSPSWNYFTRFIRHDIYVALFNFLAVYWGARYLETRTPKFLYGAFAAISLAFCTKEDMYALAPLLLISLIFALVWEVFYASDMRSALRSVLAEVRDLLGRAILPMITGTIIFALIWLVFYTSFFSHPENWNAVEPALSYWWGQHEIQRIGGPWWYYFPHLVAYEQLIFFAAIYFLLRPLIDPRPHEPRSTTILGYATLAGFAAFFVALFAFRERAPLVLLGALTLAGVLHMRRWLPDRFMRFCIVYALGAFVFYSWAQEKVPWLLIPILTPMTLVAARWFGRQSESGNLARPGPALALAAVGVFTIWSHIASNYLYDAPRPEEDPAHRHAETLAYVQSTYDVHTKVMAKIESIAETIGTGTSTRLAISGDSTWPLSWYVRHYPVNWGAGIRKVDFPVLILDLDAARAVEEALAPTYDKVRFQIRGWWEPNWGAMNLTNIAHFLLTREPWSPVGSSDAVMFSLKDPQPGMTIPAIDVNPPPPPRGYPVTADQLAPVAVWGHQGSGAGELSEPRSLAVDADYNLYVADSKNHRIHKFAPDGKAIMTWGTEGTEPGQFKDPHGVALGPDGLVYVADTWNHRVQKFDSGGNFIKEWREQGGFWGPRGIAVSPDGNNVYVTDTGNKRVVRFDSEGNQLGTWGGDGSKPGQLIEPVGIVVDSGGRVFVADTGNRRVQVFDAEGTFLEEHAVSGWEEFYTEPYMALDGERLYITDSYNHRIAAYDNWQVTYSWGRTGDGPGAFNRPIGVAVDRQGAVYVADTLNHRIQKFALPESSAAAPAAPKVGGETAP